MAENKSYWDKPNEAEKKNAILAVLCVYEEGKWWRLLYNHDMLQLAYYRGEKLPDWLFDKRTE